MNIELVIAEVMRDFQMTGFADGIYGDFVREVAKRMVGWQPIETAPKNETPVDIWRPGFGGDLWGGERCTNMRRTDLGKGNVFYSPVKSGPCCVRDATHWMPLPDAPNAEISPPRDAG